MLRGRAMGVFSTAQAIGICVGPVIGGLILGSLTWPWIFWVTVPVAAPATVAYTVNTGDTPDTVATSHGVTVDELLAANGWSQRDRVLYAGDKIQIPVKPA